MPGQIPGGWETDQGIHGLRGPRSPFPDTYPPLEGEVASVMLGLGLGRPIKLLRASGVAYNSDR